jgi:hypothetical protein
MEADSHCKREGMQLVSIETEEEHHQIVAFLWEHKPGQLKFSCYLFHVLNHVPCQ